jgi:alkanesulfonate monooxygenase SsuD/methylene tetrahydromethanopterin reductase-like flavin-dependent oxidoreductase (luciferase family)
VPSTSVKSWEQFLKTSESGGEMLGDADTWDELDAKASIIVGSPATVRRKLWDIIEQAKVGNLLVQFHFGNMKDELARKSQRLFATEVAPYLRADSKALFARQYPELADLAPAGAAE